ncbi:MAG: helix-turn-helix domain-containing protein, partial [Stenotrophomonas maltophilia]
GLRSRRKSMADKKGVPPYMIFSDASLQDMAYYFPQRLESFARINGVGMVKLEEHGEEFLALIRHYAQEHGLRERPFPSRGREKTERPQHLRPGEKTVSLPKSASTYEETKKLFLQKLPISEIASRRGLAVATIFNHLERLVLAGERLEFDHVMPSPTRCARIEAAFQETDNHFLAPVRELLGEEYSYDELHLVRLWLRQRQVFAS